MYPTVHSSTVYNMEATYVSINRRMAKEDVIHGYNGILLSHKNEQNCAIC